MQQIFRFLRPRRENQKELTCTFAWYFFRFSVLNGPEGTRRRENLRPIFTSSSPKKETQT